MDFLASSLRYTPAHYSLVVLLLLAVGSFSEVQSAPTDATLDDTQMMPDYVSDVRSVGRSLGKAEAQALEVSLRQRPDDIGMRARLIGYYFYRGIRDLGKADTIKARRRHIMWLVEHHPASRLAGAPEATLDPSGHDLADRQGYETVSVMWRALCEDENADKQVLLNAANYFRLNDKPVAEKLLLRTGSAYELGELYAMGAIRVTMMNQNGLVSNIGSSREDDDYSVHAVQALKVTTDRGVRESATAFLLTRGAMAQALMMATGKTMAPMPVELAHELLEQCPDCNGWALYYEIRGMMAASKQERRALARENLVRLERLYKAPRDQSEQSGAATELVELYTLATVAYMGGEREKSIVYADKLLAMSDGHERDGEYGIAFHKGHILLGHIALDKGDVKGAADHLMTAAAIHGGTTIDAFGPDMSLAKALLVKGRKAVVVNYLEACRKFWPGGKDKLTQWSAVIRDGGMPDFGANSDFMEK